MPVCTAKCLVGFIMQLHLIFSIRCALFFLWITELLKLFSCCTLHGFSRHTLDAAWQHRLFGRICGIRRSLPAEHVNCAFKTARGQGSTVRCPWAVSPDLHAALCLSEAHFTCCLQVVKKMPRPFLNTKSMNSEFAVSFGACVYGVCGQKHKDLWFLCLEVTVLISLCVRMEYYCCCKQSSVLCIKFLCSAGSSSQLVSNPSGGILLCFVKIHYIVMRLRKLESKIRGMLPKKKTQSVRPKLVNWELTIDSTAQNELWGSLSNSKQ